MFDRIECKLLRTTSQLEAFVPEWINLWRQDPHATPFQRPEWLIPWWHKFGQPDLRAVTIFERGELAGFLPLYVYLEPSTAERKLMLLGVGTTDYLGGVFAPRCTPRHLRAAFHVLVQQGGWDVFDASQLCPGSLLFELLQQPEDLSFDSFETASCSRMPAVSMSELPVKIRRNAMYYRNRAMRLGNLELVTADASNWRESFEELRRLHTARWQNSGEPGVMVDERVIAWHLEALPRLQESRMLRLCALRLNGIPIGAFYSLADPPGRPSRTQYIYITAFAPEHAELRPGTLLLALAIERAKQEGIETIDMLRGEEAYKKIWHLESTPTYGFRMLCNQSRGLKACAAAIA